MASTTLTAGPAATQPTSSLPRTTLVSGLPGAALTTVAAAAADATGASLAIAGEVIPLLGFATYTSPAAGTGASLPPAPHRTTPHHPGVRPRGRSDHHRGGCRRRRHRRVLRDRGRGHPAARLRPDDAPRRRHRRRAARRPQPAQRVGPPALLPGDGGAHRPVVPAVGADARRRRHPDHARRTPRARCCDHRPRPRPPRPHLI